MSYANEKIFSIRKTKYEYIRRRQQIRRYFSGEKNVRRIRDDDNLRIFLCTPYLRTYLCMSTLFVFIPTIFAKMLFRFAFRYFRPKYVENFAEIIPSNLAALCRVNTERFPAHSVRVIGRQSLLFNFRCLLYYLLRKRAYFTTWPYNFPKKGSLA